MLKSKKIKTKDTVSSKKNAKEITSKRGVQDLARSMNPSRSDGFGMGLIPDTRQKKMNNRTVQINNPTSGWAAYQIDSWVIWLVPAILVL